MQPERNRRENTLSTFATFATFARVFNILIKLHLQTSQFCQSPSHANFQPDSSNLNTKADKPTLTTTICLSIDYQTFSQVIIQLPMQILGPHTQECPSIIGPCTCMLNNYKPVLCSQARMLLWRVASRTGTAGRDLTQPLASSEACTYVVQDL